MDDRRGIQPRVELRRDYLSQMELRPLSSSQPAVKITDFRQPHLQGPYDAQLDLTEAASIARRHELRAGMLELKGHGDWSLDQFASTGLLTLRDLGWQDDQIAFSKASLSTDYSFTDQQLKLSKLQGKIFGGSDSPATPRSTSGSRPAQHLSPAARKTSRDCHHFRRSALNKSGRTCKTSASQSQQPSKMRCSCFICAIFPRRILPPRSMLRLTHSRASIPPDWPPEPSKLAGRELRATPKSNSLSTSLPRHHVPRATSDHCPRRAAFTTPPPILWIFRSSL